MVSVSEQRNTEEGDFPVLTEREMKREPKSAPLFSWSLTLVPRSFLLNRTETLATQAISCLNCIPYCNIVLSSGFGTLAFYECDDGGELVLIQTSLLFLWKVRITDA